MAKYIRTKDGIYDFDEGTTKIENGFLYILEDIYIDNECYHRWDYIGEVLKEAETIPELCDGFYIDVCEPIFEKQFIFSKKEYYKFLYIIEELKKENVKYTVYGFIKTSKGLIYVAKMNEKGDFKLWD